MKQRNKSEIVDVDYEVIESKICEGKKEEPTDKSNNKKRQGMSLSTTFVVASAIAFFTEPQFCDAGKVGFGIAAAAGVGLATSISGKLGAGLGLLSGGLLGAGAGGAAAGVATRDTGDAAVGAGCGGCFGAAVFGIGGLVAGIAIGYNVSHTYLKDWMKERNEKDRTEKVQEIKQTSMNILSAPGVTPQTIHFNDAFAAFKM